MRGVKRGESIMHGKAPGRRAGTARRIRRGEWQRSGGAQFVARAPGRVARLETAEDARPEPEFQRGAASKEQQGAADKADAVENQRGDEEIGRASCRERVCQAVEISVDGVS